MKTVEEAMSEIKVGDIIVSQWGYSMILYDFFQVVSKTPKTLKIVELKKKSLNGDPANLQVQPIPNEFASPVLSRRVSKYGTLAGTLPSQTMDIRSKYNPNAQYFEDHMD